jgi:microcystin-dependent protein
MPPQTFGIPKIDGETLEDVRFSTQFWLQQLFNRLDQLSGVRGTPTFYNDIDANTKRITSLGLPAEGTDAQRFDLCLHSESPTGEFNAQNRNIVNVSTATRGMEAVNLEQLRNEIGQTISTELPRGVILLWSGSLASIPLGWALCDGTLGTPDLRGRFVPGAGGAYAVGATGGADTVNLAHSHTADGTLATDSQGAHIHTADGTLAAANESAHTHGDGTYATGAPSATTTVDNDLAGSTVAVASDTHTHDVTGTSGAGSAHGHDVTGDTSSNGAHTHDVTGSTDSQLSATTENRPAFYALAYIMKL